VYEFQSMMCQLSGLDVSNASMYDGASAVAEAVLMAIRGNRKSKSRRVLVAGSLHPDYVAAVRSIVGHQQIALELLPLVGDLLDLDALARYADQDYAALVIPQPNFFGRLESVHALTDWAHANQMLVIAVVNPTALALLAAPGEWGAQGADIAVGEGQPLGLPLASGGPYFGFLTCKDALVRQMPGRIIGRTVDLEGKPGYTLTLQAREQHIRRSKATSNICTNQGLAVTAATIYLSLLGFSGLQQVAANSHLRAQQLKERLARIPGVAVDTAAANFHEFVVTLPIGADSLLRRMAGSSILAGLALGDYFPERANQLLVCVTETKTAEDLDHYVDVFKSVLAEGK
jgi:glycine dehydrogenase subunit 1